MRRVAVGQRVGVEDGTTHQPSASFTHQSSRPGERRQQLAPFHPQDRIVNDAFSSIGICDCVLHRCLEGWEQGTSLNSRHHPEQPIDGVASTIVRGRSIGRCLEHRYITWPASRYGRRLRSPGSPFVTPGGANTWRYPPPGWDTSISRSVSGEWNTTAICVIGDATVMWTSARTARSARLKPRRQPRRQSRSPVRPVGTGKIWPASGGRSRGPAPAAIRGL